MISGTYHCADDDHGFRMDITVEAKETEKSYILTLIEDKSRFPSGHIEMLFKKSKRTVIPKVNRKPGGHPVLDHETWFIIYPFQAGIPFLFELQQQPTAETAKDADQNRTRSVVKELTVTEWCPHCENEVAFRWNVLVQGYKAFCPVCGKPLMLCDECQHREQTGKPVPPCDYDSEAGACREAGA